MLRPLLPGLLLVAALGAGAFAGDREAVPAADARKPVLTALRKQYRDELRSKDAAVKRTLAKTLIERAGASKDAAERYVLLDQAIDAAEDAGDVALAMDAVARLGAAFSIERADRANKCLAALAKGVKESGRLAEIAGASIDVAGIALPEGDGSAANKAIGTAEKLAKKVKMDGLAARADALSKLVRAYVKSAKAAAAAEAVLAETPDDPAAHLAIGRHLWFGLNDWKGGAPHVGKSDDTTLRNLVLLAELEGEDGWKQKAADAWWTAAEQEKDVLAAARMRARAASYGLSDERLGTITYWAWDRSVALTDDFSKFGPANLALATIRTFIEKQKIDKDDAEWRTKLPRFPDVTFAPGVEYLWHLETNQGPITIRFFPDTAPLHVANFLYLTEVGFFDGLIFHRVIPRFMAQGGCPKKSGTGSPGYFIDGEFETLRKHDKGGLLSMANTGTPKSDGSQFFITFVPYPSLDGKHTVFGEVVDGKATLDKLEKQGTQGGRPKTELTLDSARISVR